MLSEVEINNLRAEILQFQSTIDDLVKFAAIGTLTLITAALTVSSPKSFSPTHGSGNSSQSSLEVAKNEPTMHEARRDESIARSTRLVLASVVAGIPILWLATCFSLIQCADAKIARVASYLAVFSGEDFHWDRRIGYLRMSGTFKAGRYSKSIVLVLTMLAISCIALSSFMYSRSIGGVWWQCAALECFIGFVIVSFFRTLPGIWGAWPLGQFSYEKEQLQSWLKVKQMEEDNSTRPATYPDKYVNADK